MLGSEEARSGWQVLCRESVWRLNGGGLRYCPGSGKEETQKDQIIHCHPLAAMASLHHPELVHHLAGADQSDEDCMKKE